MSAFGYLPKTENSTVADTFPSTAAKILFCGDPGNAQTFVDAAQAHGHQVVHIDVAYPVSERVKYLLSGSDIVLLDVTTAKPGILKIIEDFHEATATLNLGPRVLCFSTAHRNPRFVLAIKQWGAQYVRVDGVEMVCEAINLLYMEMRYLERNGPCFEICHRFSQGSCAPGEEIATVILAHDGNHYQLPLGLMQRFVFDFLGQHRRVALDASQIVSGLNNDWFYRDHALNGGSRLTKKIRRPAVKVMVQRIRDAMRLAFGQAHLNFDPLDVLRSYPVEGSRRVLYKLTADVRWQHPVGRVLS